MLHTTGQAACRRRGRGRGRAAMQAAGQGLGRAAMQAAGQGARGRVSLTQEAYLRGSRCRDCCFQVHRSPCSTAALAPSFASERNYSRFRGKPGQFLHAVLCFNQTFVREHVKGFWLLLAQAFCQARGDCASFVFGFVTFMSIGGFPSFVEDMKIFQRERFNGHYGVVAFVISNTLSAMPYLILITFLSGTICYFMFRLHPGFFHYLFFVICLYASVTVVESLMMAKASVVPNFLMGIIIGAGIQLT